MSVFPYAVLALVGAIALSATSVQSSDEELPVYSNLSCTSDQTQCALGCCPYPNAECCSDGYECCQHGQTCIPYMGICLGIDNNEKKKPALVSSRATPVDNLVTACPPGTTTCGPDRCCNFAHATCCMDGQHCCPHGYRCDLPNKRCVRNSDTVYSVMDLPLSTGVKAYELTKTDRKDPFKSCPGGNRQCPSYMSCCLNDDNVWSCCPNPTSPQYQKKGSNMCCNTMSGYICCPAWAHACTYIGCM